MLDLFFLCISLLLVIKSSDYAIKYSSKLAHSLRLPTYVVGFIIVAIISILPETFISIDSALRGIPSFGLGTLFGSNVADLTLIIAIILFFTTQGIRVGSKILESNKWYPFFIALPIFAGIDGYYSRLEGLFLVVAGAFFYYVTFRKNYAQGAPEIEEHSQFHIKDFMQLLASMALLLFGAHLTVQYSTSFAHTMGINSFLVGMFIVGLGTTLPELIFSIKAVRHKESNLALGDILGTVISDATIAVGAIALISPFAFPQRIIYVTATFMLIATLLLFTFMRSGKNLSKKEALFLFLFYIIFALTEYSVGLYGL